MHLSLSSCPFLILQIRTGDTPDSSVTPYRHNALKKTSIVRTFSRRQPKTIPPFAWLVAGVPFVLTLLPRVDVQMIARDIHRRIIVARYVQSKFYGAVLAM
jgi:hypothetical protein